MGGAGCPVAVILNYHEVTQDPRVMKQARALAAAGFEVHVYCDLPDGFRQKENIDGVWVHRFSVFDPRNLKTDWTERYSFLHKSGAVIGDRIGRLAAALTAARTVEAAALPDHLFRFSYVRSKGKVRRQRKRARIAALALRWLKTVWSVQGRTGFSALFNIERLRRRLYQADSVLLAEGFVQQDLPHHIDVVHAHDIYTLPAAVLLKQTRPVQIIYDAHEYEPARATKIDPSAKDLPAALEEDCFPFVDAMVTVSESIADLYAARFAKRRAVVLYNAPEMDPAVVPLDSAKDVRATLPLAPDTPTVVFTGGVQGPHRGVDRVVEALRYLPDCHLVLIGPRERKADDWVRKMARQHDVAERIIMVPSVDARDVPSAIAGLGVAVCPFQDVSLNHRFAMPNKLFEAAFAGIPICVSDLPEMRRFVETMGNGMVMDQTNPVAIADAIRTVLQQRERYTLDDDGRRALQKQYGWAAQADKLLALYADLGYPTGSQTVVQPPDVADSMRTVG